ncbi:peroxide stress protein YaaA [soil metagenome]
MLILLHSSKTMHRLDESYIPQSTPELLLKADELAHYLQTLSVQKIAKMMKINDKLASDVFETIHAWNTNSANQRTAIHSFAGDIYSGLQVHTWSQDDLTYAQQHLRILSGLYGILRPLDGIMPYRLELGYRLPKEPYKNLYTFWGDTAAQTLYKTELIVDLAAKEYSKLMLPYLPNANVISPRFLTISSKTGEPSFVVVHAKIARGAFAAWLIRERIEDTAHITKFNDLGYTHSAEHSTANEPTFIVEEFKGLGLSVRLHHKA